MSQPLHAISPVNLIWHQLVYNLVYSDSRGVFFMQLQTIGAYETKTHLSDLLRRVQAGQGFVITQRGVPVADLLPAGANLVSTGAAAAARMRQFMQEAPAQIGVDIKALQDEGRD